MLLVDMLAEKCTDAAAGDSPKCSAAERLSRQCIACIAGTACDETDGAAALLAAITIVVVPAAIGGALFAAGIGGGRDRSGAITAVITADTALS